MKTVCMISVIVLCACSNDTSGLGFFPDGGDPGRALHGFGDHTAQLSDAGSETSEDATAPETGEADAGPVDEPGDASDLIGQDSGSPGTDGGAAEPQGFAHELFVGSWIRVAQPARDCSESATVESTTCRAADPSMGAADPVYAACHADSPMAIDAEYALDPAWSDFVRWEGDVWVGERRASMRSLSLWLVDKDTMLGDFVDYNTATGKIVCTAWQLVRD